jgi:preprotein translocase subunit SecG
MIVAFLVIHAFVTVAMIGLILLQKSDDSGPFGIGGGHNSLFTARGAANVLTRTTAVLAAIFIGNCILIGIITDREIKRESSFFENSLKKSKEASKKNTEHDDKNNKGDEGVENEIPDNEVAEELGDTGDDDGNTTTTNNTSPVQAPAPSTPSDVVKKTSVSEKKNNLGKQKKGKKNKHKKKNKSEKKKKIEKKNKLKNKKKKSKGK